MSFEVFKFLDPRSISITLTASDTNRLGVVQDGTARRLTPRECARLQGFPETYKLLDNDKAVYKRMGNAVSVPVIEALTIDLIENNQNIIDKIANAKRYRHLQFAKTETQTGRAGRAGSPAGHAIQVDTVKIVRKLLGRTGCQR